MAKYGYSFKVEENMAKAVGVDLAISQKHAIEIANLIRGLNVEKAKRHLENAIAHKRAIPVKRYCEASSTSKNIPPMSKAKIQK